MKASAMEIAKVFWSGRSQAVRLPREFRVDAEAVRIRRHGNAIILEPMARNTAPGSWTGRPDGVDQPQTS